MSHVAAIAVGVLLGVLINIIFWAGAHYSVRRCLKKMTEKDF